MADDTSTTGSTDGASATDDDDSGSTGAGQDDAQLPEGARRALAAARKEARDAQRAQKAAEARVKEYDDRDKTETQKLTERAETAERTAAETNSKLMRLTVAVEKGLPAALVGRLQGSTLEELTADADELLKLVPASGVPSFDGGARRSAEPPKDMNSLIRSAAGRG